jgi:hypothetical protein
MGVSTGTSSFTGWILVATFGTRSALVRKSPASRTAVLQWRQRSYSASSCKAAVPASCGTDKSWIRSSARTRTEALAASSDPLPPDTAFTGRQQQDMDPSPKRQRLQQVTPSSSRDVEAEGPSSQEQNQSRDNSSLKVLANAAEQAGGQSKQQHQQTMTTSLHHAPISPSTPSVAHTRTPSWHSLKSPGGSSHARNPSWQLPWAPSPDQHLRQRRSRDFAPPPGGYGGGGGGYASRAGGPPEMIQAAPSWDSQGPPPPQVIEAIRSRSFEDSPPYRQHVRGNSAASFGHYGFYSPEGHTYNANIMGTPHRSLRPPPTDLPPPPPSYDPYGGSGGSVYDQQQPLPAYAAAAPNHVSPGNSYYEPDQPSLPPAPPPPPSSHQYQPYTYVQQPQQQKEVTVLKKKFSWKHYPVVSISLSQEYHELFLPES